MPALPGGRTTLFGPNYAAMLHSRSGDDLLFFFLKLVLRHAPILRILLWYWRLPKTVAITARCQSQRGKEVQCGNRTSRGSRIFGSWMAFWAVCTMTRLSATDRKIESSSTISTLRFCCFISLALHSPAFAVFNRRAN